MNTELVLFIYDRHGGLLPPAEESIIRNEVLINPEKTFFWYNAYCFPDFTELF